MSYGYELILDLHNCDESTLNRDSIDQFFTELCNVIEMEKCEVYFWDDLYTPLDERQTKPHTKGTSAVCFILTSSIVVHTLDILGKVFVNIFSCKDFNSEVAGKLSSDWFDGQIAKQLTIDRM